MRVRVAIALAVLAALADLAEPAEPATRMGLRLDAATSIQWEGSTLFLDHEMTQVFRTTAGQIRDVWLGPAPGTFVVNSERGLGLLLGMDVLPVLSPDSSDTLLRSNREDVLWAATRLGAEARAHTFVYAVAGRAGERAALDIPGRLLDFDVSDNGVLAYVDSEARIVVRDSGRQAEVPIPAVAGRPSRIFISRDNSRVWTLIGSALCAVGAASPVWDCVHVDSSRQAIVRRVRDGGVQVEPLLH